MNYTTFLKLESTSYKSTFRIKSFLNNILNPTIPNFYEKSNFLLKSVFFILAQMFAACWSTEIYNIDFWQKFFLLFNCPACSYSNTYIKLIVLNESARNRIAHWAATFLYLKSNILGLKHDLAQTQCTYEMVFQIAQKGVSLTKTCRYSNVAKTSLETFRKLFLGRNDMKREISNWKTL